MDTLKKYLEEAETQMASSPLRQTGQQGETPGFSEFSRETKQLMEEARLIRSRYRTPVNVVFMGEVKSGKSTLINCFAGRDISRTDVLEATAAIILIEYAQQEQAYIEKISGKRVEGTLEDIRHILEKEKDNMDFFKSCRQVTYQLPLESIREINMVDTPGIATVTFENAEKARSFIQHSDVVVWVLNSNHLGQVDVEAYVNEVAEMGKPILLVLNRIDEVGTQVDKVMNFADQQLGIYVEEIFPLSARDAYEGVREKDLVKLEKSGFKTLSDYLMTNVERKAQAVQHQTIFDSMVAILKKDRYLHLEYVKHLEMLHEQLTNNHVMLRHHHDRILEYIKNDLKNWVEVEFLETEMRQLQQMKNMKDVQQEMNRIFSPDHLRRIVEERAKEMIGQFNQEWEESVEQVKKELFASTSRYTYRHSSSNHTSTSAETKDNSTEEMIEGAKSGAITSGAFGAVLAGYAAWLGPGAAYITIGSALGSIMPPLLIAGAAAGVVSKWMNNRKNNSQKQEVMQQAYREAKNHAHEAMAELYRYLEKQSQEIVERLDKEFAESLNIKQSSKEIKEIMERVTAYAQRLESQLRPLIGSGTE